MNGIHRNARIARLVLGGLALLCLLLFVAAREQERAALTREVGAAERRALRYADAALRDPLAARTLPAPLTGEAYRALLADLHDRLLDDPLVARVRLWAPDGTLLFSTAANERATVGRLRVNEDPAITSAAGGTGSSRLATAPVPTSERGDAVSETDLFETFAPLRVPDRPDVIGAVQIDQYYDAVRSRAAVPWQAVQRASAGLAVLFGALLLWSFRRRPVPDGAGQASWAPAAEPTAAGHVARSAASGPVPAPADRDVEEIIAALRAEQEKTISSLLAEHEAEVAALRAELALAVAGEADGADAGGPAAEAERHVADAERRAAEAERRAVDLELMLVAAQRAAQEATDEALAARSEPGPTAALEAQAVELLEARVVAAEDRAAEAERRLAELDLEGPPADSNGHVAPTTDGWRTVGAQPYIPTDAIAAPFQTSNGHRTDADEPEVSLGIPDAAEVSHDSPDDLDGVAAPDAFPDDAEGAEAPDAYPGDADEPGPGGDPDDDNHPTGPPVAPISAEASELRARLARSADRKKRSLEP